LHKNALESLISATEKFGEISPCELKKAHKQLMLICNSLKNLECEKLDTARKENFLNLNNSLSKLSARFTISILNSETKGQFKNDWVRFAQADLSKLKNLVAALREFLVANKGIIKISAHRKLELNPDLEELFEEFYRGQAISERTWVFFATNFKRAHSKWEKSIKDPSIMGQLCRIIDLFSYLREIRDKNDRQEA